jgi:tetratricopeptide (TPR) repeat protein
MLIGCRTSSSVPPVAREPAGQSSPKGTTCELVRQAAAAVQAGQFDLGIAKYIAALNGVQQQDKLRREAIEGSLALAYQKAGRWQESVDAINTYVRDSQGLDYLPYVLLGHSYARLERWQESLEAFQRAAKLKPDGVWVQADWARH